MAVPASRERDRRRPLRQAERTIGWIRGPHSRRISVGSVSYTISSCEVDNLPVDLLFYADGEDVYNDISKIKCLGVHR